MKKENKIDQAVLEKKYRNIVDICEREMTGFDPETTYYFGGIFSGNGRIQIAKALFGSGILAKDRREAGVMWCDTYQYCSDLSFVLGEIEELMYDENGELFNPLHLPIEEHVSQPLASLLKGNEIRYAACGKYVAEKGGLKSLFYVHTSVNDLDDLGELELLLAVKWGGANSNTRGLIQSEARLNFQATYFEKETSAKGGEGVDYIVIPLDSVFELNIAATAIFISNNYAQARFRKKWQTYQTLSTNIEQIEAENWELLDEAIDLASDCENQPVASLDFVTIPKKVDTHSLTMPKISLNMDEKEMSKTAYQAAEATKELRYQLSAKRTQVEAWKNFAPKFASLQPEVERLHGTMKISGDRVVVVLPDIYGEKAYTTTTYSLSEVKLKNLVSILDTYAIDIDEAERENRRLANRPSVEELLERQSVARQRGRKPDKTEGAKEAEKALEIQLQ